MPSMLTAALGVVKVKRLLEVSGHQRVMHAAQRWLFSSGQGQSQMSWPGYRSRHDVCVFTLGSTVCFLS